MGIILRISTLIFITYFVTQLIFSPFDVVDGSPRKPRCFTALWSWFRGEAVDKFEKNVISVNPDNVRFFLYPDPKNQAFYQEIIYNDPRSLQTAKYRFGAPWKVLIHGYTMSQFGTFPQNVKNAYLEEYRKRELRDPGFEGYNLLVVDWGPLADPKLTGQVQFFLSYGFAVMNVKTVGVRVGEFIQFLRKSGALESYNKVHIVGFSLGAHVSGNAGATIFNATGERVSRITGLDPAGPSFYLQIKDVSTPKLNKDSAKFVDVYHSNMGALGTLSQLGHVDYYPNGGGPIQPYCLNLYNKAGENRSVEELGSCSHNRAPFYFSRSISTFRDRMMACGASSYEEYKKSSDCPGDQVVFGEYADSKTRGKYYLDVED